jgi:hypothetical protein
MTPAHLIPLPLSFPPRQQPAAALGALAREIPEHGRAYICSDRRLGVLSLPAMAVWTNGRVFWWQDGLGGTTWPAADAPGVARRMLHWSGPLGADGLGR